MLEWSRGLDKTQIAGAHPKSWNLVGLVGLRNHISNKFPNGAGAAGAGPPLRSTVWRRFQTRARKTGTGILVLLPNYGSLFNCQRLSFAICKMGVLFIYMAYLTGSLKLRYIKALGPFSDLHTMCWEWGMLHSFKKRRISGWMPKGFNSKLRSKS